MTSHVVIPESTRYDLTTGGWILVKARLNAGEYRRMMSSMMGQLHVTPGQTALTDMPIDPMQAGVTIVVAHLLDWTQTDPNGAPMLIRDPVTGDRISSERLTSMLDSLSIPVYTEIESLIQAHYDRARQAEKKNDLERAFIAQDLAIARRCGWRYEWVAELDVVAYDILLEQLMQEHQAAKSRYGH